jgi:hypothetical protein
MTTNKDMGRDLDVNGRRLEYANRYEPIQDPPSPNM